MKRTRKSSTPSTRLFENRVMKFLHCTNEKGELHLATRKFLSTQGTSEGEGGGLSIGETTRASFSVETFDSVGKRAKMQRSSSRTLIPLPRALSCDAVESIYRDSPLLSSPANSPSFFREQRPVQKKEEEEEEKEPYRVVLPNCGKPRPGSEKEDLIKAERNEPAGKTTGVHLSRSRRTTLLKEFLLSCYLCREHGLAEQHTPAEPRSLPALHFHHLISSDRYISKAKLYPGTG